MPERPLARALPVKLVALSFAVAAAGTLAFARVFISGPAASAAETAAYDARPALRLANRAGLVTISLAARAEGYRIRLLVPEADLGAGPELVSLVEGSPTGDDREPPLKRCGPACWDAAGEPPQGGVVLRATVRFVDRVDAAAFRFSWPPSPDRQQLLERAVERTAKIDRVSAQELVTSDPRGGFYRSPRRTISGQTLVDTYAVRGARDVRELPARAGLRRLAYELPRSTAWIELTLARDGRIVRDRFVTQNRLWTQTITPVAVGGTD